MVKKSSRLLLATALTLAFSTAATSVVLAQTADRANDRITATERDSGFDMGWLGLIGLLGLAGLKRREQHPTSTTAHTAR